MARALTDEQVEWAYEQCRQGRKEQDVASDLFIAKSTLTGYFVRYRKKTGVPHLRRGGRSRSSASKAKTEWAYKKWCEGYAVTEIAAALGISRQALYCRFKGYCKPPKPPKPTKPPLVYEEE